MITEVVDITFLLWDDNYEVKNAKILIEPNLSGSYIDEQFLKGKLDTMPTTYCINHAPYEIPIKFSIPNKVDPHSFYIHIMPKKDFPENFRKNGIILVLGRPWIEMTQYTIE
ncbi:MAG: hypothetical protein ACFFDN_21420 [Candidatus Hodarchaeota archaeon]